MIKQEKTAPILLTETETNQVAGGDNGNHFGQIAKDLGVPAWSINNGNAVNAPGYAGRLRYPVNAHCRGCDVPLPVGGVGTKSIRERHIPAQIQRSGGLRFPAW